MSINTKINTGTRQIATLAYAVGTASIFPAATVQGATLTVNVDGDMVSLTDQTGNTVNVTQTDIEATNGVIHVIDGVLLPTS